MKKYLLLAAGLVSLTFSTDASAQDRYQSNHDYTQGPLTGLYMGAYVGYGWNDVDTSVSNLDVDGDEYGFFVGYQIDEILDRTVGRLGIGLNGAVEAYYTDSSADDSFGGVAVEKDYDWGISFRPGLTILDNYSPFGMKPYGILGYRSANYDASGAGASGDESYDGFELGIGTELYAYDKLGVRLDYTHVFYEEKDGIDPDENNLRLGLAYHF